MCIFLEILPVILSFSLLGLLAAIFFSNIIVYVVSICYSTMQNYDELNKEQDLISDHEFFNKKHYN